MRLHYRKYGKGDPLIILHGLFGSSDNWHSLARRWGAYFQVFTLDQRNHGSSPHESAMNYSEMARDLHQFITEEHLESVHILGHSMGGKVAMLFASLHPDLVKSIIILDIGIDRVEGKHESILEALREINPKDFTSRDGISQNLHRMIKSPPIEQFLLKNVLRRMDGSLSWKFNRDSLLAHYEDLTSELNLQRPFMGPVLFIRGELSNYLDPALSPELLQAFPFAEIKTISHAGHWLHADQPEVLFATVLDYIG